VILDSFRLTGKNALVTGSSRGMGAAIAIALAEAGANVALHASQSVPAEVIAKVAATGVRHIALTADVRQPELAVKLVDQAASAFGSLDILVNNAGITRRAPAVDYPIAEWDEVIAADLTSVFRLCQAAGRLMVAQGSGKIVNIASLLSFQGGITVPAYAAAKGGVAQLTKALANEWASKGVCVNAIAPATWPPTSPKLCRKIPPATARSWNASRRPLGLAARRRRDSRLPRLAASDYVNGHILVVDGGWMGR